jgi:hypothetical protein
LSVRHRTETIVAAASSGSFAPNKERLMQMYFLHLNVAQEHVVDTDGVELSDLEAAKSEARETIRELAAEYIKMGKPLTLWSIRICDADGRLLAEVAAAEALHEVIAPVFDGPRGPDGHL